MNKVRYFHVALLLFAVLLFCGTPAHAKDDWIQVRSKNFFLIGNASEKDIRKVATRLEQFRETFRAVFTKTSVNSPVPMNVVVFKSESSYKNFKPKRADGKIDNFIAGYFQPGQDVNYITLSMEGDDTETFSTIFHEYVHSVVNTNFGKGNVPPWFNEGLAEYYSTFAMEDDQKAKLGLPLERHLNMLNQNKLIPLSTLFRITGSQLHETADHSRSIFYSESWALIHYLIANGKSDALNKFLSASFQGTSPDAAFQQAFQIPYSQLESDLRKYVQQNTYKYNLITFKQKLVFDTEMSVSPLTEAESSAYLGDLLYHTNRWDDAEPFLINSLNLDPASSMANTSLGMVKLRQRKFEDAAKYLESAIKGDQKNYLAFYWYARMLSRQGQDEFGSQVGFSAETAAKMREALSTAIKLKPSFPESYDLLAFVALVTNDHLDEALEAVKSAQRLDPGNEHYQMRIAEIYQRQKKYGESRAIVERIANTTDDKEIKRWADQVANQQKQLDAFEAQRAALEKMQVNGGGPPVVRRGMRGPAMSAAEVAKLQKEAEIRDINTMLRKTQAGEERVLGHIAKITCKAGNVAYNIASGGETFTVTSKDFESLQFDVFTPTQTQLQIGCDIDLSQHDAVVTYRKSGTGAIRGELRALEIVAPDFRFMSEEEMKKPAPMIIESDEDPQAPQNAIAVIPPGASPEQIEKIKRDAMMNSMRSALRKPADGEKQVTGFLQKIECSNKGVVFIVSTQTGLVRLQNDGLQQPPIRVFTPDLAGVQFGCSVKPVEYPAVVLYKVQPDPKNKTEGTIVALDFLPKGFTLN